MLIFPLSLVLYKAVVGTLIWSSFFSLYIYLSFENQKASDAEQNRPFQAYCSGLYICCILFVRTEAVWGGRVFFNRLQSQTGWELLRYSAPLLQTRLLSLSSLHEGGLLFVNTLLSCICSVYKNEKKKEAWGLNEDVFFVSIWSG